MLVPVTSDLEIYLVGRVDDSSPMRIHGTDQIETDFLSISCFIFVSLLSVSLNMDLTARLSLTDVCHISRF